MTIEKRRVVGRRIEPLLVNAEGWIFGVRAYLEQMERAIPLAVQREIEELEPKSAATRGDEQTFPELVEAERTLSHWLPRVLAYSFVAVLYSVLERHLVELADRIARDNGFPLGVRHLKQGGIDGAKELFKAARSISLGEIPSWNTLTDLKFLRHRIMHAGGAQGGEKERKCVRALMSKYVGELELAADDDDPHTELEISLALCRHFVDAVDQFFAALLGRLGMRAVENTYAGQAHTDLRSPITAVDSALEDG